jgi:hypothetical protein
MTTAEEQEKLLQTLATMDITRSADFRSIYSNWAQCAFSPFDITLIVGEAIPVPAGNFEVEQKARVIFHPAEAKVIAWMLLDTVKKYEDNFGKVAIPPGVASSGGEPLGGSDLDVKPSEG